MIRRLRQRCALTVVIGSSEHRGEKTNPFSGAERRAMLRVYLREARIADVRVVTMPDGPSITWALERLIRTYRPDFLFLSTEHDAIADLAERRVRVVRFRRSGRTSSTRIRTSIVSGGHLWRSLTGRSVVRWILRHHGLERVREAYRASARRRREPTPSDRVRGTNCRKGARARGPRGARRSA